jgi:hypothetical protein
LVVAFAQAASREAGARPRFVREPEAGQRHGGQADSEFLQRLPPGDGLGHSLGQFIEFVVHTFPFVCLFLASELRLPIENQCAGVTFGSAGQDAAK